MEAIPCTVSTAQHPTPTTDLTLEEPQLPMKAAVTIIKMFKPTATTTIITIHSNNNNINISSNSSSPTSSCRVMITTTAVIITGIIHTLMTIIVLHTDGRITIHTHRISSTEVLHKPTAVHPASTLNTDLQLHTQILPLPRFNALSKIQRM